MDNRKWLQRKYPETFNKVSEFLNDDRLSEFKTQKYKIGKLTKTICESEEVYSVGTLIMFKRSNPVTSFNYPMHFGIAKTNNEKITSSGYHSFHVFEGDFTEVNK